MIKPYTVSYVNIGDLLTELGILSKDDREDLFYQYFDWVTYGDASYTMVHNKQVVGALEQYWKDGDLTPSEVEWLVNQFWKLVSESDYVNMEN